MIIRDEETTTFSDVAVDDCRGVTGTLNGTTTVTYQEVDAHTSVHLVATVADSLQFQFIDGSYGVDKGVSRFVVNDSERSGVSAFTQPRGQAASPNGYQWDNFHRRPIVRLLRSPA